MIFKCKNIRTSVFLVFVSVLVAACHKEKSNTEINGITGYTWELWAIHDTSDYYLRPFLAPKELKLNGDRSFSFNLNGSICTGTYSWDSIDSISANVSFSIKKWSGSSQNDLANTLKNVLGGINKCYYLKGNNIPQVILGFTNPTMVLDFEGNTGYLYVYR